jgi:drug/metabolite transporter (DMT)-like permease
VHRSLSQIGANAIITEGGRKPPGCLRVLAERKRIAPFMKHTAVPTRSGPSHRSAGQGHVRLPRNATVQTTHARPTGRSVRATDGLRARHLGASLFPLATTSGDSGVLHGEQHGAQRRQSCRKGCNGHQCLDQLRLGVRTSLTPWDVAAIRFTVAGVLLLPFLAKRGLAVDRLGWTGVAAIIAGCGAPMVLLVNAGLLFAPAAHAGALFPGVMPLMVAILAAGLLKEAFSTRKWVGLGAIVAGALGIVWGHGGTVGTEQTIGHVMFLLAGLTWAGYTVALRRARLEGLHAAAIAAVGSLVLYLPIYVGIAGTSIFNAPLPDIALQAVVQGVLTAVVALLLYGRMVSLLGATSGAAFVALTPVMTGLMGIPVLGERPSAGDWAAILIISLGVYVVSGGPMPRRIASPPRSS